MFKETIVKLFHKMPYRTSALTEEKRSVEDFVKSAPSSELLKLYQLIKYKIGGTRVIHFSPSVQDFLEMLLENECQPLVTAALERVKKTIPKDLVLFQYVHRNDDIFTQSDVQLTVNHNTWRSITLNHYSQLLERAKRICEELNVDSNDPRVKAAIQEPLDKTVINFITDQIRAFQKDASSGTTVTFYHKERVFERWEVKTGFSMITEALKQYRNIAERLNLQWDEDGEITLVRQARNSMQRAIGGAVNAIEETSVKVANGGFHSGEKASRTTYNSLLLFKQLSEHYQLDWDAEQEEKVRVILAK